MTIPIPELDVDPFSTENLTDPHPMYEQLREAGPLVRLGRYDIHAVARHAEVQDSRHQIVRDQNVARFQVAMDDLPGMGGRQSEGDPSRDFNSLIGGQFERGQSLEIVPIEIFHHDQRQAIGLFDR